MHLMFFPYLYIHTFLNINTACMVTTAGVHELRNKKLPPTSQLATIITIVAIAPYAWFCLPTLCNIKK